MKDTAVEEVRAVRRRILQDRYGGSADRMIQAAIESQRRHPRRVVNLRRRTDAKTAT